MRFESRNRLFFSRVNAASPRVVRPGVLRPGLIAYRNSRVRFNGLTSKALAVMLRLVEESTLKRANVWRVRLTPALKALVYEPFGQAVRRRLKITGTEIHEDTETRFRAQII